MSDYEGVRSHTWEPTMEVRSRRIKLYIRGVVESLVESPEAILSEMSVTQLYDLQIKISQRLEQIVHEKV